MAKEHEIFQNTVLNVYTSYMQKSILKMLVKKGLVINETRKDASQKAPNLNNMPDVSDCLTLKDKLCIALQRSNVLAAIEEYEYERPYRHFCYFSISGFTAKSVELLVKEGSVNLFSRRGDICIDTFVKPSVYSRVNDEDVCFKFSRLLTSEGGNAIKYVILAIINTQENILEVRFDRVGIAYKGSYSFYKDCIEETLNYFKQNLHIEIQDIDFKAVVDHVISKSEEATLYAQKMVRNGSTAYLEAFEGEEITIPILGELRDFINGEEDLFSKTDDTKMIREMLESFLDEIEVKSDLPMVKIILDESSRRFGITHNYKETGYSLFMLYGNLVGEELMSSVREYIIRCYKELKSAISANDIPAEKL